jgi:hypothetical protein
MEYPFKSAIALNQPPTWLHLAMGSQKRGAKPECWSGALNPTMFFHKRETK